MNKQAILLVIGTACLAACQGPAAKAGEAQDKADAAAAGKAYTGNGPNEKVGEAQDRAIKAAKQARDAQADAIKQQGKEIRTEADTAADKLDAQAKQIRADAAKRAQVVDDRAKAVRQ